MVTLPAGVVNIGKDGSFCYVLKDGVITKQDITTGISSRTLLRSQMALKPEMRSSRIWAPGRGMKQRQQRQTVTVQQRQGDCR